MANVTPPRFKPLKVTGIQPLLFKKNVTFNYLFVLNALTVRKTFFSDRKFFSPYKNTLLKKRQMQQC